VPILSDLSILKDILVIIKDTSISLALAKSKTEFSGGYQSSCKQEFLEGRKTGVCN